MVWKMFRIFQSICHCCLNYFVVVQFYIELWRQFCVAYLFNCCLLSWFRCQLSIVPHPTMKFWSRFNSIDITIQKSNAFCEYAWCNSSFICTAHKNMRENTENKCLSKANCTTWEYKLARRTHAYRTNQIFMSNWNRLHFILLLSICKNII